MKTVKRNDEIKRVKDQEAYELVKTGWAFAKKSEYKKKMGKGSSPTSKPTVKPMPKSVQNKGDMGSEKGSSKYRDKKALQNEPNIPSKTRVTEPKKQE